ncbi:hypothetical protein [Catellatospora tritici]|uniref:hypothetical protein n=1 Tax=Catellatospora tritici TaxID=2851566 RepID=UPI001C2D6537|nr:hypothetical protein [Catellatospora tritici]MBV1850567.1 hypothetical protein [Catellatospora tritici]
MKLNPRSLAVIAASAAALVAVTVAATAAAPGDPTDPATAPHPQYDYADPSKSFLVELNFGATSATLLDASVVEQRSRSHLGDPPLLRLSLTDEDGAAAGTLQAWDPRWYLVAAPQGGEELKLRNGPGALTFPFDPDTASVLVRDLRAGADLATVDLRPAVREFCLAHPSDPDCIEADLAITSTAATGDPLGVIGKPVVVKVKAEVANLGPDGPVDADVTQAATGSAGVTVTPAHRAFDVDGLAVGSPVTVSGDYTVVCTSTGAQTVTVTTSVKPEKSKVADLVAANNTKSVTFAIDCAVPVTINVKPGSLRNPVEVNPGALPLAVLTTTAGEYGNPLAFDAATIQAATVRVGVRPALVATGAGAPEMHGRVHLEDSLELDERTQDGDRDGVLHARANQLGIQPDTTEICVRGRFGPGGGTSFFGCDHITVVPTGR